MWLQHSATLSHTISTISISRLKYTSDFCHEVNAYGGVRWDLLQNDRTHHFWMNKIIFSLLDQCLVARLFLLNLARRDSFFTATTNKNMTGGNHTSVTKMLYLAHLLAFWKALSSFF